MDYKRIKEEMEFITGVISPDIDYLFYLLLKDNKNNVEEDKPVIEEDPYSDKNLEDWFSSLDIMEG